MCAGDRLEVAGMELTQSRSGDIQGYSIGNGTEHLLLPNPAKEENMSKQTSVRSEVDGWLHGEATSYQYMDCGKYRIPVFPYKVEYPCVQFSHPQQSIPDIFPSPGSWTAAEHQPAVRALLAGKISQKMYKAINLGGPV